MMMSASLQSAFSGRWQLLGMLGVKPGMVRSCNASICLSARVNVIGLISFID
jgi:hypothetical protein